MEKTNKKRVYWFEYLSFVQSCVSVLTIVVFDVFDWCTFDMLILK